jgi:hypothetical protein
VLKVPVLFRGNIRRHQVLLFLAVGQSSPPGVTIRFTARGRRKVAPLYIERVRAGLLDICWTHRSIQEMSD